MCGPVHRSAEANGFPIRRYVSSCSLQINFQRTDAQRLPFYNNQRIELNMIMEGCVVTREREVVMLAGCCGTHPQEQATMRPPGSTRLTVRWNTLCTLAPHNELALMNSCTADPIDSACIFNSITSPKLVSLVATKKVSSPEGDSLRQQESGVGSEIYNHNLSQTLTFRRPV